MTFRSALASLAICLGAAGQAQPYEESIPPAPPTEEDLAQEQAPPDDMTDRGPFRIQCTGSSGPATFFIGKQAVAKGGDCGSDFGPTLTHSRRFPSGEQLLLVMSTAGIGGRGDIVHVAPGQPVRSLHLDYMAEFTDMPAPDSVAFAVSGTGENGQEWWTCEIRIDWSKPVILSSRKTSPGGTGGCD